MSKIADMPLSSGDERQALAIAYAAADELELDDDDRDQLNTALAWIAEALGIDPTDF